MNLKKIISALALGCFILSSNVQAQDKIIEGKAIFNLEFPTEGMDEQYKAMMPKEATIYFKEGKTRTEMDMSMMTMVNIYNDKDKTMTMLMDMMGKKYEVTGGTEGFGNSDIGSLKDAESVTYNKKDTKEILGYKCYKASVKMSGGTISNFYVTDAIAVQAKADDKLKLTGFPLEIEVNSEKGKIIMLATAFDKEPTPNCFVVPEGYKKVTQEELQQELGGF